MPTRIAADRPSTIRPSSTQSQTPVRNEARAMHGTEFLRAVDAMADRLGVRSDWLLNIMKSESGLQPGLWNMDGARNVGLIQLGDQAATTIGTTVEQLSKMPATEQLKWVEKFFALSPPEARKSQADLYLFNMVPAFAGKPDSTELPSWVVQGNRGFDVNGDGRMTIGEFRKAVAAKFADAKATNSSTPEPRKTIPSNSRTTPSSSRLATDTNLRVGTSGPQVSALQLALRTQGFTLEADGTFGPQTEAAVRAFQAKNGLSVDGIVGPKTSAALLFAASGFEQTRKMLWDNVGKPVLNAVSNPVGTLFEAFRVKPGVKTHRNEHGTPTQSKRTLAATDTSRMTQAQKFDHFQKLIQAAGGTFDSRPEQRNLVSLRRPTNTNANPGIGVYGATAGTVGRGLYDDRTVMLWIDSKGQKQVREFNSNTEPSAQYRGVPGMSEDANGDGTLDQARIPEGHYEFALEVGFPHGFDKRFLRPTKEIMAEADINQDGVFDSKDKKARRSEQRTMLIHEGGYGNTQSAGCQTLPPGDFTKFMDVLLAGGMKVGGTVRYTLVDVPD